MTSEEQKRYINYLADRVNAADLESRAMKLVLQDFLDKQLMRSVWQNGTIYFPVLSPWNLH